MIGKYDNFDFKFSFRIEKVKDEYCLSIGNNDERFSIFVNKDNLQTIRNHIDGLLK